MTSPAFRTPDMVLDTSAVVAWLEGEPEADLIGGLLEHADRLLISAATLLEAGIVVETRRGEAAGRELDLLVHRLGIEVVPVDADTVEIARGAYRRFGKGHHAASLNFGDCFSYALAAGTGDELLYVGDDFNRTDVVSAIHE